MADNPSNGEESSGFSSFFSAPSMKISVPSWPSSPAPETSTTPAIPATDDFAAVAGMFFNSLSPKAAGSTAVPIEEVKPQTQEASGDGVTLPEFLTSFKDSVLSGLESATKADKEEGIGENKQEEDAKEAPAMLEELYQTMATKLDSFVAAAAESLPKSAAPEGGGAAPEQPPEEGGGGLVSWIASMSPRSKADSSGGDVAPEGRERKRGSIWLRGEDEQVGGEDEEKKEEEEGASTIQALAESLPNLSEAVDNVTDTLPAVAEAMSDAMSEALTALYTAVTGANEEPKPEVKEAPSAEDELPIDFTEAGMGTQRRDSSGVQQGNMVNPLFMSASVRASMVYAASPQFIRGDLDDDDEEVMILEDDEEPEEEEQKEWREEGEAGLHGAPLEHGGQHHASKPTVEQIVEGPEAHGNGKTVQQPDGVDTAAALQPTLVESPKADSVEEEQAKAVPVSWSNGLGSPVDKRMSVRDLMLAQAPIESAILDMAWEPLPVDMDMPVNDLPMVLEPDEEAGDALKAGDEDEEADEGEEGQEGGEEEGEEEGEKPTKDVQKGGGEGGEGGSQERVVREDGPKEGGGAEEQGALGTSSTVGVAKGELLNPATDSAKVDEPPEAPAALPPPVPLARSPSSSDGKAVPTGGARSSKVSKLVSTLEAGKAASPRGIVVTRSGSGVASSFKASAASPKDKKTGGSQASSAKPAKPYEAQLAALKRRFPGRAEVEFLPFLRHTDGSVDASVRLFAAMLTWRDENIPVGLDSCLGPLRQGLLYFRGEDREGNPLAFLTFRGHNPLNRDIPEVLRSVVYRMENMRAKYPGVDVMVTVMVDRRDVGLQNQDPELYRALIQLFVRVYPECLHRAVTYPATAAFKNFFSYVVRPLLPAKVKERLVMCTELSEIHRYIDPAHLPPALGGMDSFDYLQELEAEVAAARGGQAEAPGK